MFDDFHAYFFENVVTPYYEFEEEMAELATGRSSALRAALTSATTLFHLREHLPAAFKLGYREVEQQFPEYGMLGDVVNAAKHKTLTRAPKYLAAADALSEYVLTVKYEDDDGPYFFSEKRVAAKLSNGDEKDLRDLLRSALNFWFGYLYKAGVLSKSSHLESPPPRPIPSRADAEGQRHDMVMIQGVRFRHEVRFYEYDYGAECLRPWDVSDCEFQFTLKKPMYTVALSARHNKTGELLEVPVELSEKEAVEFSLLGDAAEQQRFLHDVALRNGAVEAMMKKIRGIEGG